MTSRRTDDSRKQWADFSAKRRKAELGGAGDVYGAVRRCRDCRIELASVPDGGCQRDDCPYRPHEAKARAKPVQTEQTHAQLLATRAYRQWWYPGWTTIEHRSSISPSVRSAMIAMISSGNALPLVSLATISPI